MSKQSNWVILAGVRNLTHLVYAASYVRNLLEAGPVHVAVLDTGTFLGKARVSPEDVAATLPTDPDLSISHPVGDERWAVPAEHHRILLSIGAPSLRAYSALLRTGRRPEVVVIDEGIGSYGDWRARRDGYRRNGGQGAWPVVRAMSVATGNRVLTGSHWSLYERGDDGWTLNDVVAQEFLRRVFGDPPPPGSAVYLTQPWPELGVMSRETYSSHLREVEQGCTAAGLNLAIRPHPAEDPASYDGFTLTTTSGLAECDRSIFGADLVLGSNSTSLLNLAAIHCTRVLRVTMPQLRPLDDALSPRQRSLLDAFLPPAREVSALEL